MSEYTDDLIRERLATGQARTAYMFDAGYRSKVVLFRRALEVAADNLRRGGEEDAEKVLKILADGFPSPQIGVQRGGTGRLPKP